MTLLELARQFRFVRELEGNRGQRVEAIQKWGGGKPGDSWCAFWVTMVLDLFYEGKSLLARTGSCDVILQHARHEKWIVETPEPGDLYLNVRNVIDAYHVGFCTSGFFDDPIKGRCFGQISGNTSEDGTSANGDRVSERPIKYDKAKHVFLRVPAPA